MLNSVIHGQLELPPERLLRSYLDLLHTVFVDLRSSGRFGAEQLEYVTDLGNAMHNISSLIAHYDGGYLNDQKFRVLYLRPFDTKWAGHSSSPIMLERELDETLSAIEAYRPNTNRTG